MVFAYRHDWKRSIDFNKSFNLFSPFLDVGEDEENGKRVKCVEIKVWELQQGSEWYDWRGMLMIFPYKVKF